LDPALADKGRILYQRCLICHGPAVVAAGFPPDLRASSIPLSAEAFKAIVQRGTLTGRGMPIFPELSDQDLLALRHYIRQRARYNPSSWTQVAAAWSYTVLLAKAQFAKWGW
jgi:quinohemoprotein ethanol dehydrogenase